MKKPAIKSPNRINVFINQNFIIRVTELAHENQKQKTRLTSANKLSEYLKDEKIKLRLFEKLINSELDKHTFCIRNRLKIDFCSK